MPQVEMPMPNDKAAMLLSMALSAGSFAAPNTVTQPQFRNPGVRPFPFFSAPGKGGRSRTQAPLTEPAHEVDPVAAMMAADNEDEARRERRRQREDADWDVDLE